MGPTLVERSSLSRRSNNKHRVETSVLCREVSEGPLSGVPLYTILPIRNVWVSNLVSCVPITKTFCKSLNKQMPSARLEWHSKPKD